ncbi:MAG: DUF1549 domain-containing protein, partial [Phycisphaerales bacterium]|nr:DUF1549 domain-containing protein [Phycisphaerales bacterium]
MRVATWSLLVVTVAPASAQVDFNRDVRPILSDRCYACHGPDEAQRKGDLRLDVAGAEVLSDGTFLARVTASDPLDRMPPPEQEKHLTDADIEVLRAWIESGAAYETHWSFLPSVEANVPSPVEGWPSRNVIDRFVQAELRAHGLAPSPEADRRTLIRRLSLDLRGLPPSREEVEAFVADPRPDAYEHLVETYLESPHHGERLAMQWLDAARYADTNGYHIDNERRMWRWRDWVIDAFERNAPYDAFVVEQLAGDLLPDPTLEQRIATGFNRNHMINFEGGAIPEEYLNEYVIDRVNTTSSVFLGLTVNCAQCHDHKYDPISQREFYQLYAFFNGVPELGLNGRAGNADPIVKAPTPDQRSRLAPLDARVQEIQALLDGPMPEIDAAQASWAREASEAIDRVWRLASPTRAEASGGATFVTLDDGSLRLEGANPPKDVYEIDLVAPEDGIGAVRLEVLTDPSMFEGGPGRADNGNLVLTGIDALVDGEARPIRSIRADFAQENFPPTLAIDDDPATGWAVAGYERHEPRLLIFALDERVEAGRTLTIRLRHESIFGRHAIGRFRVATTGDDATHRAFLPSMRGTWSSSGPEPLPGADEAPERVWTEVDHPDGVVHALGETPNSVTALRRTITAPSARTVTLSLGSDDGLRVLVNGALVHEVTAPRGIAPGQDRVEVALDAGPNEIVLEVTNVGGPTAYVFDLEDDDGLDVDLPTMHALMRGDHEALREVYRTAHSPIHRELREGLDEAIAARDMVLAEVTDTMVMAEKDGPRTAMVLERGLYDKPTIEVEADVPAALGGLP